MRLKNLLAGMLAAAPMAALAAGPTIQPGYQINLGPQYGAASYDYMSMMSYLDTGNTTLFSVGQPTPVSPVTPLPVADSNSASYTAWPTLTAVSGVYTPPSGTRKLVANATAAGNVVLTDGSGNTWTIALAVGQTEINAVPAAFTTTATASFLAVR